MQKILFILSFLQAVAMTTMAQCKYATTFDECMNNEWTVVDSLCIETRSSGNKMWTGGADFKPSTTNEELDKTIRQKARFMVCHDTLYVNCSSLKYQNTSLGNGYATGFRFDNNKICFVGVKVEQKKPKRTTGAGVTFSVGSGVKTSKAIEKQACYILSDNGNKVQCLTRKYMKELLMTQSNLLQTYSSLSKAKQESPEVMIDYLDKLQLLGTF